MIRETFREHRARVLTNIADVGHSQAPLRGPAPLCFLLLLRVLRPVPAPRSSPCHRLGLSTRGMLVQIRSEGPGLW